MAGPEGSQGFGRAYVGKIGAFPERSYSAVGTINAAIVALGKALRPEAL
jgi:hypothetical protein